MKVGKKAQGTDFTMGKTCVSHHGSRMRHGKGRPIEKAIETRLRQQGRKACKHEDC
jgi:hypothetical protein